MPKPVENSFVKTKLRDKNNTPFAQAKAGEIVYFDLFTKVDVQSGKDYLRKG